MITMLTTLHYVMYRDKYLETFLNIVEKSSRSPGFTPAVFF